MRLEVNVTYRCNATCQDCNRAIGLARFKNAELTAEQMGRAVDVMIAKKVRITRLTLAGGEPLLNSELQGILDHAARLPGLRNGRLLTNDVRKDDGPRQTLKLPSMFRWVPAPLDDPTDVRSGKEAHVPFFVSPADLGMHSHFGECRVKGYCGKGFDANGWSMCGIAGTLGRLLRIDPYDRTGPKTSETPGICQHCPYGMPRKTQRRLSAAINRGEHERISPTYKEAFARHAEDPVEFERF